MWEFVDKAFYINLDHRKDRRDTMTKFFKEGGFPDEKVERIPAVCTPYNGMIGCAKSHISALETAKRYNYKAVLIAEDDLEWIDFETTYPKLEELVSSTDWDVCMLTGYYLDITIPKVNAGIYTNCYIVRNHYYDKLIQNMKEGLALKEDTLRKEKYNWMKPVLHPLYKHIYNVDVYWIKLQMKDKWIAVVPMICQQVECYSDINKKVIRPPCGISISVENPIYKFIVDYFKTNG